MTGLGVHMADNLNYLLGPAARVTAFSKKVMDVGTLDNATTATLEYQSGPLAFLGTSTVIPDIARTAVWEPKRQPGTNWMESSSTFSAPERGTGSRSRWRPWTP